MAETKKPTGSKAPAKKKAAPKKKPSGKQVKDSITESIIMKMRDEGSGEPEQPTAQESSSWEPPIEFKPSAKRATAKEVNFFLRQMSVLLSASVPLMRALKVLADRVRSTDFRVTLVDVMAEVEKGSQLWAAMSKHPAYFNAMMVNVIRTGEESGSLVSAMKYLANYRDRESEMLRSVERAVTYPLFMLVLAIGLVFVLITLVIPVFAEQFKAANVDLPWPTAFVFGLSETLTNFWAIVIGLGLIGYLIYKKADFSAGFIPWWDRIKLRMPIFGKIMINIYTVQFATMMSLLIRNGLPLLRTLDLVRATMVNSKFKKAFDHVRANVERGRPLSDSLREVNVFPLIVVDMIAVGEEAGSLPEVLDQVADNYQKEVDHDTAVVGTLVEPILIVSLGGAVGFIAIAMFLPYFKMASFLVP
jgi:type IV pilus assembly protein PilC